MPEYTPEQFAAVLMGAIPETARQTHGIVRAGAMNIKRDSRRNVLQTAPRRNAHAHLAIDFDDPQLTGAAIHSEIGYDKSKPGGALGNLLEFGGGGDHSPAHRDLARAAEAEEPRFVQALEDMAEKVIE